MIEYSPKNEYLAARINNILQIFPLIDQVSLSQYLEFIGLLSKNQSVTPIMEYCFRSKIAYPGNLDGLRLLKKSPAVDYDVESLNAFAMMVALGEYAGDDNPPYPLPIARCAFPYDYIYTTEDIIFTIINYGKDGEQKLITHNVLSPEKYMGLSSELKQVTVVTASEGFATLDIEKIPIRGEAMIARINRNPNDIVRKITLLGDNK